MILFGIHIALLLLSLLLMFSKFMYLSFGNFELLLSSDDDDFAGEFALEFLDFVLYVFVLLLMLLKFMYLSFDNFGLLLSSDDDDDDDLIGE